MHHIVIRRPSSFEPIWEIALDWVSLYLNLKLALRLEEVSHLSIRIVDFAGRHLDHCRTVLRIERAWGVQSSNFQINWFKITYAHFRGHARATRVDDTLAILDFNLFLMVSHSRVKVQYAYKIEKYQEWAKLPAENEKATKNNRTEPPEE